MGRLEFDWHDDRRIEKTNRQSAAQLWLLPISHSCLDTTVSSSCLQVMVKSGQAFVPSVSTVGRFSSKGNSSQRRSHLAALQRQPRGAFH